VTISGDSAAVQLPSFINTYAMQRCMAVRFPGPTGVQVANNELTVVVTGGMATAWQRAGHFVHAIAPKRRSA